MATYEYPQYCKNIEFIEATTNEIDYEKLNQMKLYRNKNIARKLS